MKANVRRRAALAAVMLVTTAVGVVSAAPGDRVGNAVVVNATTAGFQWYADVAVAPRGNAVAVWQSQAADNSSYVISGRRLRPDGTPDGDEFQISTASPYLRSRPLVAMNADGAFVAAWISRDAGGTYAVVGRRYGSDGTAAGDEFRVNTGADPRNPDVGIDAAGNVTVVWEGFDPDLSQGIYAQRYDATGAPIGGEFRVNATIAYSQTLPAIAVGDSGFVVTWVHNEDAYVGGDIYAQRYGADGTPQGAEFRVNSYVSGAQEAPSIGMDALGNFVVAWDGSVGGGDTRGIAARRFDALGVPRGDQFTVNNQPNTWYTESTTTVAAAGNGAFVIGWYTSDPYNINYREYSARRYDANGAAAGSQFRVTVPYALYGFELGADADGDFTAVWATHDPSGSLANVLAQRFQGPEDVDLSVTVDDSSDPVHWNGYFAYFVHVTNHHAEGGPVGTGAASGIGVEIALSPGTTLSGYYGGPWTCTGESALTCTYGDALDAASTATLTLLVYAPGQSGSMSVGATVSGQQYDSLTANNSDAESTTVGDLEPDAFSFTDLTGVERAALQVSNPVTISGIELPVEIWIYGGEYSLNGGEFTILDGTVVAGDEVRVRHVSSPDWGGSVSTAVQIGTAFEYFDTQTVVRDVVPDEFTFPDQANVARSTVITSDAIVVTGINDAAPVTISNGSYSIDGGPFVSADGVVTAGQSVRVRHTSSAYFSAETHTILNIGGFNGTDDVFTSTTVAADTTPDPFSFTDRVDVARNVVVTSNAILVSGIDAPASISVVGGQYRIDAGPITSATGTVNNGQSVQVLHTSSTEFSATRSTTLTIGTASDTFSSTTLARDTTPEPFAFAGRPDVERDSTQTSDAVVITGINDPAPISVADGAYSIDGAPFTSVAGQISNGQSVRVQHVAATSFSTAVQTTLTVGGASATFTSTTLAQDVTPDTFAFTAQPDVARSAVVTSNAVTVTGINDAAPISVSGGAYSIDGGAFATAAGTVTAGQSVRVRHTSADAFATATHTTLTIGGISDTFTSTTEARDTAPDAFSFADASGVATATAQVSNAIAISGINDAAAIGVSGGEYSVNGGAFTAAAGTVNAGDQVRVRHTSASSATTAVDTTLTVGGVSDTFTSTTGAADTTPDAFAFADVTGVRRSARTTSGAITVAGINAPVAISVAGGDAAYSKNGGSFTSAPGSVVAGDSIRVRVTSAGTTLTTVNVTVTIGGVTDVWSVTTGTK